MDTKIQESLKRKLLGTKADFDQQDVEDYFQTLVDPSLKAAGITRFGLFLCSASNQVIMAETVSNYLDNSTSYIQLISSLRALKVSFFNFSTTDNNEVAGYAENDLDWLILKYETKDKPFVDSLIDSFWPAFYEFA